MSVTRVLLGHRWEAEGKSPQASRSVTLVQKPTLSSCLKDRRPRLPSDLHKCSPPYPRPHHPHLLPTPLHKHDLKKKFKKTPFKQSYLLLNSSKLFQKQFSNFQSQVGVLLLYITNVTLKTHV